MEPLISIQLHSRPPLYWPGDELVCDYQIDAIEQEGLVAVEASVLWFTEGKGDEDMGVHYFERRVAPDAEGGDLRSLRRFSTGMPNSPLTYRGEIIRIEWCVRVRAFLQRGNESVLEHAFQLGSADYLTNHPAARPS